MSLSFVELGQITDINPRLPRDTDETQKVSFLTMASVSENGEILNQEERILSETKKGFTYFERNDVLLAKITPCFENGKAVLVDKLNHQIGFGSTEFHVLRPYDDALDARYLFYMVWNDRFRFLGQSAMKGAAGQKRVSADFLKEFRIPLPPLAEQKRIAAILDKADSLRRKRQQAIQLADQFLRAVFLDMFGDPVTNPKGWDVDLFGNVGTLDRGKSKHRPRNDPILLGGEHPLIQTGDVANSNGYIREYSATYSDIGLKQSRKWSAGTLCITIAANIAKTGILTFDACFPDSVVGFLPSEKVTVEYIQHWLKFLQRSLEASAPESAQKNINLEILRNLNLPVPDKFLQEKFSTIVNRVLKVENDSSNSLSLKGNLFESLSQKAFAGEL
ncbi:MAG: restriction endonuclease subunit S [Methylobacter sp.]|uniref:restriction endonuclease subunit S n=1 Tax=Methylobacter sp. TaxID=2051955 RepID=UPI002590F5CD|nr:restriction endonuclease subunit S [Methylobacter sp.]MCL7422579.1 restriction endonuclease subunit S [Methylobacter sp.]